MGDNLYDARNALEEFCERADGDFRTRTPPGPEYSDRYSCNLGEDVIELHSHDRPSTNDMTGKTEVPEDWWLEFDMRDSTKSDGMTVRGGRTVDAEELRWKDDGIRLKLSALDHSGREGTLFFYEDNEY